AAEAIGKLKGEGLEGDPVALLTAALDDPEPAVRGSAALAIWHHGEGARPAVPVLAAHLAPGEDPDVRWKAAYALMRIDDPGTHEPLRGALADDHAWVQTFAAWGLRNPPDPQGVGPLGALLSDPESSWTARAQALWTLKKLRQEGIGDPKAIRDLLLLHLLREKHPLASEALIEALAAGAGEIELPFLVATLEHPRSVTVRRATIRAAAGVLLKEGHPLIEAFARHDDPLTRAALAAGLAECGEEALPFIARLLEDGDRRVRSAAVGSLGRLEVEERWQLIRRVSADPDLAVRTTAIDAIAEAKPSGWVADLVAAFEASGAPDLWELRALILEALKEEREAVEPLARRALGDPFPSLRRRAAEILGEEDPAAVEAGGPADPGPYPLLTAADLRGEGNPRLILETARGDMVLELYLADAPRHVSNIVHLARSGFYDGLTFHRVVPSFVVQGGDPRADGWGDAGYHLVDEINPRPYLRGSLGMPKAGNDTGGCQIFITHLPTPHLDGRYTVFGRVVEGLPVIDRLEVGDRIVRARVDESRLRPRGP
ncbi:MAG: peptidylprolyl isomerase, partial [Planctomycetota bacterium]